MNHTLYVCENALSTSPQGERANPVMCRVCRCFVACEYWRIRSIRAAFPPQIHRAPFFFVPFATQLTADNWRFDSKGRPGSVPLVLQHIFFPIRPLFSPRARFYTRRGRREFTRFPAHLLSSSSHIFFSVSSLISARWAGGLRGRKVWPLWNPFDARRRYLLSRRRGATGKKRVAILIFRNRPRGRGEVSLYRCRVTQILMPIP